jgi:hypothetical protein
MQIIEFKENIALEYLFLLIKEDEMGRAFSAHEDKRHAYRVLVGKAKGKRPLRRPRSR